MDERQENGDVPSGGKSPSPSPALLSGQDTVGFVQPMIQGHQPFPVANDQEDIFDGDSAYGAFSDVTDTVSMTSSIMKFREENGRTYHSYGSTEHWGPCDEDALDQQDISHHFWTLMLRGELYLAPVRNPHVGMPQPEICSATEIGPANLRYWNRDWNMGNVLKRPMPKIRGNLTRSSDVAEKHPEAEVKGIDVAPIQPNWVPPNAKFELDDFNMDWSDESKYDLIHERELLGSVTDWPKFYAKCFKSLKPGGWIDCSEPSAFFDSYYGTIGPDHCYKLWEKVMLDSGSESGMPFHVGPFIKERLEEAGFINVVERKFCCTIGKWSTDPWEREVGIWNQLRLDRGVQHFCERRCINNLGWRPEEVAVFAAQMRAAFNNNRLLGHHWFYLVVGQKPFD